MSDFPPPQHGPSGYSNYPRMNPNFVGSGGPTPRPPGIYWDVIGEGWRIVNANMGTWVVATLLMYAVSFGVNMATSLIGMIFDPNNPLLNMGAPTTKNITFGAAFFVAFFIKMAGGLLVYPVQASMFLMAIKQIRGYPIAIGDIFSGYRRTGPVIGAYLLMGIAVFVATLFCIIPGFYVAGALAFVPILVLDQELGVIELQRSQVTCLEHVCIAFRAWSRDLTWRLCLWNWPARYIPNIYRCLGAHVLQFLPESAGNGISVFTTYWDGTSGLATISCQRERRGQCRSRWIRSDR